MKQVTEPGLGMSARLQASKDAVGHIEKIQNELAHYIRKFKETQTQLQLTSSRYKELYELAPVGFVTLARNGRILKINE